jgi:hypothetical protein
MLEDHQMTMWRPNEPVEEDGSNLVGIDPQSKRRRSRRRAWRDGLADQTVVKTLEDVRSYRAFERTLIGGVDPRSVTELALVHRLASLLWRLRRASAIETGLFEMQGELSTSLHPPLAPGSNSRLVAQCFLRLSNFDPTLLDRVGSYQTRLWRQAAQTIWTLEAMRQPPPPMRQWLRHRVAPFTWDRQR